MAETETALYVHPEFGRLQLYFQQDALVAVDLPFKPAFQGHFRALPSEWQHKLDAYFAGTLKDFEVPVSPLGTAHDIKVWQAMVAIPYGQTRSYGEIAAVIGSAAQAVGNACGRNPMPIIIPCHRIVGRHGIGGFSGSRGDETVSVKHWLLKHERTHAH